MVSRLRKSPTRYLAVLACQVYLITVAPFIHLEHANFVFSLLIISSIGALSRSTLRFKAALALGVPSLILNHIHHQPWSRMGNITSIIFLILVTIAIQADLSKKRDVDTNTLVGAVVGYLMLATTFAVIFVLIESFVPGSFSLDAQGKTQDFESFLYYSLVTISTLGYGDIVPLTPGAQGLSAMESVIGQFYFAFLVARLLALFLQNHDGLERTPSRKSRQDSGRDPTKRSL